MIAYQFQMNKKPQSNTVCFEVFYCVKIAEFFAVIR